MVLRKVIEWIVPDDVRAKFGNDGDRTFRLDTTRTPSELVVKDENNAVEQLRLPANTDLDETLHASGVHELVVSALLNFDAETVLIGTGANRPAAGTANRLYIRTDAAGGPVIERDDGGAWNVVGASPGALKDGGAAEVDAAELAADSGTDGQVLQTDGTSASWAAAQGLGAADSLAQDFVIR